MSSDEHTSDEESRSDDSDASSDSGSENDNHIHNLIDDEAEESDSHSDASSTLDYTPHDAFPKFMHLPPELRRRIWELFCPDLVAKARVLPFMLSPSSAIMQRPDDHSVQDHFALADQTEELRAMLATHRESRSIAVMVFPDELRMDAVAGDAVVRFNKQRDVVCMHHLKPYNTYHLPGFGRQVHNVAVVPWQIGTGSVESTIAKAKTMFPNMKRCYTLVQEARCNDRQIQWCASDYVHKYVVQTYQKEIGLGEDMEVMYCWPDLDRHADFAKYTVPKYTAKEVVDAAKEANVELFDMVEFEFEDGIARYEALRRMKDVPLLEDGSDDSDDDGDQDDEEESQSGTDLDEYESDGIDDEVIEEQDESSEDEIIPTGDAGRFSSPEAEDSDVEEIAPVPRSRKRKVVSDSDDEDEPQTKRVRSRIVIDSDEEEDVQPQKRARNTQTITVSDDEDEDGVEIVEVRSKTKSKRTLASDSEDGSQDDGDDSESGEDDEEDEPPKRLSLAERLRKAREENPVSSGSEDEDEDDEDEDEEEDEEDDEGGLLDVMADEGDDDEDEEEDDW